MAKKLEAVVDGLEGRFTELQQEVQSELLHMRTDLGTLKDDAARLPAIEKALQLIATQMHHSGLRDIGESSAVSADQARRAVDGDAGRVDAATGFIEQRA